MLFGLGQVLFSHLGVGMGCSVVVGRDEFGHFVVRLGGQRQMLSHLGVVLFGFQSGAGRWCSGVECHVMTLLKMVSEKICKPCAPDLPTHFFHKPLPCLSACTPSLS